MGNNYCESVAVVKKLNETSQLNCLVNVINQI